MENIVAAVRAASARPSFSMRPEMYPVPGLVTLTAGVDGDVAVAVAVAVAGDLDAWCDEWWWWWWW